MELHSYCLKPLAPFHLGTGRRDDLGEVEELPRSDTVAAAVLATWARLGRKELLERAVRCEPLFAISSCLPAVVRNGSPEMLLPMPVGLASRSFPLEKQARKARFVDPRVLRELLGMAANQEAARPSISVTDGWWTAERPTSERFWVREERLRVSLDRLGDRPLEGLLFEYGAIHFSDDVRFVVLARFADDAVRDAFELALHVLADDGIGGDRSVGYGRFEVEAGGRYSPPSLGDELFLSLSLWAPTAEEISAGLLDEPASYEFVLRSGWVTSPPGNTLRRPTLRMLREGSVVRKVNDTADWHGRIVKVLEPGGPIPFPVVRPGLALVVPIGRFGA